jgi:transposase
VIPLIVWITSLEAAMMGRRGDQASLFYQFRLDERVPKDHLLRRIDGFVTLALADIHERLEPYYSEIGRPSVDPELMIRMLIVGYCYGLRSERRLTQEVDLHLAYRWFCRLDLDDKVPHHSTFSENRLNRFRESDILRHIFERVVMAAMATGLVKGEGFAVDASVMEANASRYHGKAPGELDWTEKQRQKRAVAEYLAALEAEATIKNDASDDEAGSGPEGRRPRRYERKPPKVISPSDPQSAWTAKANKRVQFGYGLNYLIDIENAVIVDVEATPARTYDEVAATKTMLDRTERRFDLKPKRLAADTAYGTGKFLGWLVKEKKITPHIPVWEMSDRQDGIFSRSDFRWDSKRGVYVCPNGKLLRTSGTVHDGRTLLYRASKHDCDNCPIRAKCCTTDQARKIPRDLHEDARDVARRKMKTKAFAKSRDERKRVEMRFAHLKTHHGFERMRLRGLSGARDEFHLAAIVQNLKTLALRILGPPPVRRRASFA